MRSIRSQPVPAGRRVCIVSNGGGAGVLAADACAEAGLAVAAPGPKARRRLRAVLPDGSALNGPVDTTMAVSAEALRQALLIASEDGVDALIALVIPTAAADLIPALTAERLPVPIAAVVLDQPESVRLLHAGDATPAVPAYASPEGAARALAQAARYGSWRSRPASAVPDISGLRAADARSIIGSFLARMQGGGWLSAVEADELLRCYTIPMVEFRRAANADAAVEAAASLGGHVVIKAEVPGLLHKTDAGAVELDLHGGHEVREAMRRLQGKFAGRMTGVLVEPMITGGIETIIGVVQEPVFGPVVVFGLGGIATEVLADHVARLAPLTSADADEVQTCPPADLAQALSRGVSPRICAGGKGSRHPTGWAGLSYALTGCGALRRVRMKAPCGFQLDVQVRGGPGFPGSPRMRGVTWWRSSWVPCRSRRQAAASWSRAGSQRTSAGR